eukprot:ctg_172.g98
MEHFSGALPPGTEAVLCLRCSRLTRERSGMCAHCHENVYQCRVCRYIHFDQLDAFLCAECGSSRHCRYRVHLWTRPVVRPTRDGRTYGLYRDAVLDALLTAHVDGAEEGKAAGEMSSEKLWYVYCVAAADSQGDGQRVYARDRTVTCCIRCALQQSVDALNVLWRCEEGVQRGEKSVAGWCAPGDVSGGIECARAERCAFGRGGQRAYLGAVRRALVGAALGVGAMATRRLEHLACITRPMAGVGQPHARAPRPNALPTALRTAADVGAPGPIEPTSLAAPTRV